MIWTWSNLPCPKLKRQNNAQNSCNCDLLLLLVWQMSDQNWHWHSPIRPKLLFDKYKFSFTGHIRHTGEQSLVFRFNAKDYCIQLAKWESDANRPKSPPGHATKISQAQFLRIISSMEVLWVPEYIFTIIITHGILYERLLGGYGNSCSYYDFPKWGRTVFTVQSQ